MQVRSIDAIPSAGDHAGEEITVVRERRLLDLFAPRAEWRARCCTELLVRGWTDIRADGDRVVARSSRAPC